MGSTTSVQPLFGEKWAENAPLGAARRPEMERTCGGLQRGNPFDRSLHTFCRTRKYAAGGNPAAGGTPFGDPISVPPEIGERAGKGLGPLHPLTRVGYSLRRRFSARSAAAIRFPPESDRA